MEGVFRAENLDATITSGPDGVHSIGSHHYTGNALDFRIHHVPDHRRDHLVGEIRDALGPDFDVLWEAVGTDNEHIHVQFKPKAPY